MREALTEAERGRGRTHPNPIVGALVVAGGRVIARGHHERAGGPHAEVVALRKAGERARGADLYVTLEPCNHHGRTPPCTDAILAAGVRRVVVGSIDPNPLVHGRGIRRIRSAGVRIDTGVLQAECDGANEQWFKFITRKLPWVALKAAVTLDGKLATRSGDSRWLTGAAARARVHELRDRLDAVLIGIGTALVTGLYLVLNFVFVYAVPLEDLKGQEAVGAIAASRLFGPEIAGIFSENAVNAPGQCHPAAGRQLGRDRHDRRFRTLSRDPQSG